MCGRITLTVEPDEIAQWLGVDPAGIFEPRYNIAPTQRVPVIRISSAGRRREAVALRWGLVPPWAKELAIGNKMINARSESVYEKPAFRNAIREKRCVVPASGFYEWKRGASGRLPYLLRMKSRRPFALAGLWEFNGELPQGPLETFTILTTAANPLVRTLHDRMPVILPDAAIERWLDPAVEDVRDLLVPLPESEMTLHAVSSYVNNPANEGPECLAPPQEPAAPSPCPLPEGEGKFPAAPSPRRRKKNKDAPGQKFLFDQ